MRNTKRPLARAAEQTGHIPALPERGLEAASTSELNNALVSVPTLAGTGALKRRKRRAPIRGQGADVSVPASSEILILPTGQILAHNISPGLARALARLNPADTAMKQRARAKKTLKK